MAIDSMSAARMDPASSDGAGEGYRQNEGIVPDGNRRWYALRAKPQQEFRADANLRRWGLETLTPRLVERARSRSPRPLERIKPLFPGYLFARFDAGLLLAKVRLTRGIHSVVAFGEGPIAVDDGIIALIRSRLREDGFVHVDDPRPGDTVEVVEGPLQSLAGVFVREVKCRDRVMVLLATLGSQARVQVAKASIQKAPSAAA